MEAAVLGGRIGKLVGAVCALGASVAAIATAVALVVLTACTSAVHGGSSAAGRPNSSSAVEAKTPAAQASQAARRQAAKAAATKLVAARKAAKQAAARKAAAHCAGNTDAQRVIVSVRKQHAWMCAHRKLVYSTAVTTGMSGQWTETPTGDFQIQGRDRDTVLTLNTGATYPVKYWIPFEGPLYGFHDSSWQHFPYGSAQYRTDGSHGCVHMPLKAMKWLYNWSADATAVHIS